ncbi:MAG: Hsp70 family protein [Methanoregula sp.]|jgi:molecular chaperone DnaK (HSP70)/Mg-chelatase subunit ChlD|uniref:Hsp70 family protein n=1 Tax=Methanoregula sp. TaxID=2052170 RepID=UPI0025F56C76|nr:Hsp70 family protein [Methanoregula sp.]MCK9631964.1 Hsp70 family protein [Methanoregula sp.]
MGLSVGIDLGTTFSAVAYVDKESGRPRIIKNKFGKNITPSVLCFHEDCVLYGDEAKEYQSQGDPNAIAFFKRRMGDQHFQVAYYGKNYNAEALSAILLENLIKDAENQISEKITDAVITVPAYFNNSQREATIRAGKQAGVNIICIINEPTAAAFAYGLNNKDHDMTILVYDLGGGTFDVTLAKVTADAITVLGTDGDHELGGKNWDDAIARYLANCFLEEHAIDIFEESVDYNELMVDIEKAKKRLSSAESTKISLSCSGKTSTYEISRVQFAHLTSHLMNQTRSLTEGLLEEVNLSQNGPLTWSGIDGVLLVGGSTRMPMVSEYIRKMTGGEPLSGINVDEAVALGAAIRANIDLEGKALKSLASGLLEDSRPSEILYGLPGAKAIRDVISHSLGIIAANEDNTKFVNRIILKKNTPVPNTQTRPFSISTKKGGTHEVEVFMLQGESEFPLNCSILGKYVFSGIEYTGKSKSVLDISYYYTQNGTVEVSAVQRENGKPLALRIEEIPGDMSWVNQSPNELALAQRKSEMTTIFFAIDLSGSMVGQPLAEAKKAAHNFVKEMDLSCTNIGLIVFADSVRVILEPSRDIKAITRGIDSWKMSMVGYGNYAEPFTECLGMQTRSAMKNLLMLKSPNEHPVFVIVLTDGVWQDQGHAVVQAKSCHMAGIQVIAIGFGSADKGFLRKISSTDESALFTSLNDLSSSLSKIAQAITEHEPGTNIHLLN